MYTFCNYSHEVNFKVSKQPLLWMQSGQGFMLRSFSYHLMKQLHSCKYQWSCWKKNL